MPTNIKETNLKINKLTKAQYDAAVQGGVIGENELSVLTDAELEQIQVSALPTASADELGNIYQFIGTTDANYTNGYFYKCISDGLNPATYSWERTDVQPAGSSLPSQTGNAGKFLTTDGTDASWSDKPLVNLAKSGSYAQVISRYAGPTNKLPDNACLVLTNTPLSVKPGDNSITITETGGAATGSRAVAIGYHATASGDGAIQLSSSSGAVTNSDTNTFKVANANGNFELMDANGYIPAGRLKNPATAPATMPTLAVADWSLDSGTNKYTQSVSVTGVTGTNTVFVSPAPSSAADYASSSVLCISQTTDSLTFQADSVPSNAITVNVVIMGA